MAETTLVSEIMTSPVTTLPCTASLLEAALTLRRTGYRHLVIVDDSEVVAGVLSDRDVARFTPSLLSDITPEEYNEIFEKTPVARVMSKEPATIAPETSIVAAAKLMSERKIGCLPVIVEGRLVGVVTISDMLDLLIRVLSPQTETLPTR